eukprot:1682795-Rhodomonas_salina.1
MRSQVCASMLLVRLYWERGCLRLISRYPDVAGSRMQDIRTEQRIAHEYADSIPGNVDPSAILDGRKLSPRSRAWKWIRACDAVR